MGVGGTGVGVASTTGNGGGVSAAALPEGGTLPPVRLALARAVAFAFSRALARMRSTAASWSALALGVVAEGAGVAAVRASAMGPSGCGARRDGEPPASAWRPSRSMVARSTTPFDFGSRRVKRRLSPA